MFGKKREQPEKANKFKAISLIILAFNALGCLFLYLHPKRWRRFLKGEKREIKELSGGEETVSQVTVVRMRPGLSACVPSQLNPHLAAAPTELLKRERDIA